MKFKLFAFALGLLVLLAACGGTSLNGAGWGEEGSADGRFAVQVPGSFSVTAQTALTPMGPVQAPLFAQESDKVGYYVTYVDFPSGYGGTTTTEAAVNSGIGNLAEELGAVVMAKWKVPAVGAEGKEFVAVIAPEARTETGTIVQGRVFMTDARMYRVWVVADADQLENAQAARYLNSFHLVTDLAMK